MAATTWRISDDGEFEYISLTPEYIERSLDVMRKSFFLDECVAIATELHKYPEARRELEELTLNATKDGVSVIAVEKKTGIVAAAAFNKIQVPALEGEENYFENYAARCKTPSAKALVMFMIDADAQCNLFEHCNVDCLMEIMFLATLPEYRGKGLGKNLCEISIELCKKLKRGENVKVSLTDEPKDLEPVPKIVSAIFTSFITQKIGKDLGFVKALELNYNRWSFDGKSFSERIGPQTPCTTLEFYRL